MLPDLSPRSSERGDVAHLHHGLGKLLEEELVVLCIQLHQLHGCRTLGEEDLVGAEEALPDHEVSEVVAIKLGGAHEVQGEEVLVAARPWTSGPQSGGIGCVERTIREAIAGLVV